VYELLKNVCALACLFYFWTKIFQTFWNFQPTHNKLAKNYFCYIFINVHYKISHSMLTFQNNNLKLKLMSMRDHVTHVLKIDHFIPTRPNTAARRRCFFVVCIGKIHIEKSCFFFTFDVSVMIDDDDWKEKDQWISVSTFFFVANTHFMFKNKKIFMMKQPAPHNDLNYQSSHIAKCYCDEWMTNKTMFYFL
jgi:hypothetical protein